MNPIPQFIQLWMIRRENNRLGDEMKDLIHKQGKLTEEQRHYYEQKLEALKTRLHALEAS